ncbi:MAG: DUF4864 domain-containing protein [Gammaproteobacteria bacterium]|nr:DUF4864 domain-containing protein [Gammaproteobacteria bacterium]MDH3447320.1 DUF4864 domain-containing protein [Gammaproteobacteria bacterium]
MNRFKFAGLSLVLLAWTLSMSSLAALNDAPERPVLPRPSVDLEPQEVVKIVINALSNNDEPYANAGIETTFYFASPANRVITGPLDKFVRMVKGPPYGIMVDHASSEFSEVVYVENRAYQMVHLTSADGRAMVFAFRLSKQLNGEFKDMWMTDAVWPVAQDDVRQQGF